jgi:hypothetical protein
LNGAALWHQSVFFATDLKSTYGFCNSLFLNERNIHLSFIFAKTRCDKVANRAENWPIVPKVLAFWLLSAIFK